MAHLEISQKLGAGLDRRYQQMIPRPGTGDVQEVTFGIVDILQIRIVSD